MAVISGNERLKMKLIQSINQSIIHSFNKMNVFIFGNLLFLKFLFHNDDDDDPPR